MCCVELGMFVSRLNGNVDKKSMFVASSVVRRGVGPAGRNDATTDDGRRHEPALGTRSFLWLALVVDRDVLEQYVEVRT